MAIEIQSFSNSDAKYEEYVVIFIDILGFSNAVKESANNSQEQARLIRFFNELKALISDCSKKYFPNSTFIKAGTMLFSDSIVRIFPVKLLAGTQISPCQYASQLVAEVQCKALKQGFATRGAATIGGVYYDHPVCFGPAVNEVIELEKEAKYPRVVFSKAFIEYKRYNPVQNIYHSLKDTRGSNISQVDDGDDKGKFYVNYLEELVSYWPTEGEAIETQKYIKECIKKYHNTNVPENCTTSKVSVKEKWQWIEKQFDSALERWKPVYKL